MPKNKDDTVTIDGTEYERSNLSDAAISQLGNLQFVDTRLQQLQNELAVADTARIAYTRALRNDLDTSDSRLLDG